MIHSLWRYSIKVCLAAGLLLSASTVIASETDSRGWIPFDSSRGQIALEGSVNGEPAVILLDSGADVSSVSAAFAERAGIKADHWTEYEMGGVFSTERVYGSRPFQLKLYDSNIPLRGLPIVPAAWFDLLLGREVFRNAVVQIDYPNQRIRFLSPDAVEFEGNVNARRDTRGQLLVETIIQGERAWLMLDTGNAGPTFLKRNFVTGNGLDEYEVEAARLSGHGVNRYGEAQMLRFDHAEIGPYRFEEFIASYLSERNRGLDARHRIAGSRIHRDRNLHDGLLGYEILRNFVATTDFSNGKLHLHLP